MRNKPIVLPEIKEINRTDESPRFNGRHLGVWVVLTAFLALLYYQFGSRGMEDPNYYRGMLHRASALLAGAIAAAGLLGTWVVLRDKWRGRPFFYRPGHFFLLMTSVIYLIVLVRGFLAVGHENLYFHTAVGIIFILAGLGFLARALSSFDTLPWSIVLGLFAGMLLITGLLFIKPIETLFAENGLLGVLVILFLSFLVLEIIFLPIAIYIDCRDHLPRDPVHSVGIGMLIVNVLLLYSFMFLA